MIHWIIQKNLTKSQDLKKIKSALSRNDESWEEIEIAPFSTKIPKFRNDESFKITYGSTTLMLNAYKNKELREGVFYNPDKFLMSNYVDKWKENSLNFDGLLLKFGELNKLKSNPDTTWFIRPNHDGKEFNGRVQSFNELLKWSMKVCQLELPELNHNTKVPITTEYAEEILKRQEILVEKRKSNIMQSYLKYKAYYDKKAKASQLDVGDFCYLLQPKTDSQSNKIPFRDFQWE